MPGTCLFWGNVRDQDFHSGWVLQIQASRLHLPLFLLNSVLLSCMLPLYSSETVFFSAFLGSTLKHSQAKSLTFRWILMESNNIWNVSLFLLDVVYMFLIVFLHVSWNKQVRFSRLKMIPQTIKQYFKV